MSGNRAERFMRLGVGGGCEDDDIACGRALPAVRWEPGKTGEPERVDCLFSGTSQVRSVILHFRTPGAGGRLRCTDY